MAASTLDTMLYFTNTGRVFSTRVFDIPEASRTARGTAIVNMLQMESSESISSIVKIRHDAKDFKYLAFGTKNGFVKKTLIEEYDNIRKSGLIAINLKAGDELLTVKPTTGKDDIMMVSQDGKAIRFAEDDVRETGRATSGVIGIRTKKDDNAIQMDVLYAHDEAKFVLLTLTETGFGKVTSVDEYAQQGRGGQGVYTAKLSGKSGKLQVAQVLNPDLVIDLLVISEQGQIIRLPFETVPNQSRHTQGVHIIRMDSGDKVVSIATIEDQKDEEAEKETNQKK